MPAATAKVKLPSILELTSHSALAHDPLPSSLSLTPSSLLPLIFHQPSTISSSAASSFRNFDLHHIPPPLPLHPQHLPPRPLPPLLSHYSYGQPPVPSPIFQHHQHLLPHQQQQQQQQQHFYVPVYYPLPSVDNSPPAPTPAPKPATAADYRVPEVINKPMNKCHRCGTTETPEWRRGPNGLRTLCNACGLFHAKLVRRKGAAWAAEEVLNNKVCKGKNGRRISVKKQAMDELKKRMKQAQVVEIPPLPPARGYSSGSTPASSSGSPVYQFR